MYLNLIYKNYIDSLNRGVCITKDKFITNYCCLQDKCIIEHYLNNYVPYHATIKDKISLLIHNAINNYNEFNRFDDFSINSDIINDFLNQLSISKSILDNLDINLFVGLDTCDGFYILTDECISINIPIERYIGDEDFKRVDATILHELSHIIRTYFGLFDNINSCTLGDILVEEGLACLATKYVMEDESEAYIYPKHLDASGIFFDKLYMSYIDNARSNDSIILSNYMNFGDDTKCIPPGAGYIVGLRLLEGYIIEKKMSIKDVYAKRNSDLLNSLIEFWRSK